MEQNATPATRAALKPCAHQWCDVKHAPTGPKAKFVIHASQTLTARGNGDRATIRAVFSEGVGGAPSSEPRVVIAVTSDPEPGSHPEPRPPAALQLTRTEAGTLVPGPDRARRVHGPGRRDRPRRPAAGRRRAGGRAMSWNSGGAADPRPGDAEQTSVTKAQWLEMVTMINAAEYSPAALPMLRAALMHIAPATWVAEVSLPDPTAPTGEDPDRP